MSNNNTTIFLVRHGEINNPEKVLYGRNIDLLLNEKGRKQIWDVAQKIKDLGYKIEKIYASPLSRAQESASIIAKVFSLSSEIITKDDLADADIPALAGKPLTLIDEIHKSGADEYASEYVKIGNEDRDHMANRMKKTFDLVVRENEGKIVAIVSHGDPLGFLLYKLTNPEEVMPYISILKKTEYMNKGEALKIVINGQGDIIQKELIT